MSIKSKFYSPVYVSQEEFQFKIDSEQTIFDHKPVANLNFVPGHARFYYNASYDTNKAKDVLNIDAKDNGFVYGKTCKIARIGQNIDYRGKIFIEKQANGTYKMHSFLFLTDYLQKVKVDIKTATYDELSDCVKNYNNTVNDILQTEHTITSFSTAKNNNPDWNIFCVRTLNNVCLIKPTEQDEVIKIAKYQDLELVPEKNQAGQIPITITFWDIEGKITTALSFRGEYTFVGLSLLKTGVKVGYYFELDMQVLTPRDYDDPLYVPIYLSNCDLSMLKSVDDKDPQYCYLKYNNVNLECWTKPINLIDFSKFKKSTKI